MTTKKIIILSLFFFIFISGASQASKNSNEKRLRIPSDVLQRRFSEFSSNSTFVLIKVKNSLTKEEMTAAPDNAFWYYIGTTHGNLPTDKQEYVRYMTAYAHSIMVLDPQGYEKLKYYQANDSFVHDRNSSLKTIINKYFLQSLIGYTLIDPEMGKNPAFIRMLLEHGLVVRKDGCSQEVYVENYGLTPDMLR